MSDLEEFNPIQFMDIYGFVDLLAPSVHPLRALFLRRNTEIVWTRFDCIVGLRILGSNAEKRKGVNGLNSIVVRFQNNEILRDETFSLPAIIALSWKMHLYASSLLIITAVQLQSPYC